MTPQHHQLIADNQNLSSTALARLIGVDRRTVARNRASPLWKHSGVGIPYITTVNTVDGLYYQVEFNKRVICRGSFPLAMENLDRLIYCLEHNNGKLPPTFEQSIFSDLEFLR